MAKEKPEDLARKKQCYLKPKNNEIFEGERIAKDNMSKGKLLKQIVEAHHKVMSIAQIETYRNIYKKSLYP